MQDQGLSRDFASFKSVDVFVATLKILLRCNWKPFDIQGGYTALIYSAMYGHSECVRLLVESGANKEAKTDVRIAYSVSFQAFTFS